MFWGSSLILTIFPILIVTSSFLYFISFCVFTVADSTGTHSLYTTYKDYEIMFHVSTMLPYTPNNKQQVRDPCVTCVSSPLFYFPQKPKWQVCKILNQNLMLHLPQQQETFYVVEVRNSKWAEKKWRDTNSRLTASWVALWINSLLFAHGDRGFYEIWREQVEIMLIRWLCRVAKNVYEWVKFHVERPVCRAGSTDVSFHTAEGTLTWRKSRISVSGISEKCLFLTCLSGDSKEHT